MTEGAGWNALVAALTDWRRNLIAAGLVVGIVAIAVTLRSPMAYYGAALASFVVWMAWFVLTSVDWLHRADF